MTRYPGTEDERCALSAYIKLMRAADTVERIVRHALAEHDLTISQLGVLEALLHLGPLNQTELARKILRSTGNITTVVDNLERDGKVRRERDAVDRRVSTVHLTEAGRAYIVDYFPEHAATLFDVMSPLSPDEQRILGLLCRKLGTRLADRGD